MRAVIVVAVFLAGCSASVCATKDERWLRPWAHTCEEERARVYANNRRERPVNDPLPGMTLGELLGRAMGCDR